MGSLLSRVDRGPSLARNSLIGGKRTLFMHTFYCFGLMHTFNRIPLVSFGICSTTRTGIPGSSITGVCRLVSSSLARTRGDLPEA